MKRILSLSLAIILTVLLFAVPVLANSTIRVMLNGAEIDFADVSPQIIDDRTMVPMRAIFEALGFEVEWNDSLQMIIATTNELTITMIVGMYSFMKYTGETQNVFAIRTDDENVEWITLDVSPQIINDRTLVPVRAIAEATGANVEWDHEAQTVVITTAEETERPNIHGMLTRIEYGDNVAYIFGTMHAGKSEWFPLHPMAEDAMRRADIFAFEFDLTEDPFDVGVDWDMELDELLEMFDLDELLELLDEFLEMTALFFLPDELTLEDILPEDVFENFITNFATFDVIDFEYENIANLTPVTLISDISRAMIELLGVSFDLSVDMYIADFAVENDRPVVGLNTAISELELNFDIPLDLQVYALVDFPDFDTLLEYFEETGLVEAYERQDRDALLAILEAEYTDNPYSQHMHHIFHKRCRIFAEEIARLLRETQEPTTFFVAIGAAHIVGGNQGQVLYILEDMGFDVVSMWE